jgi:type IV pilus assembly protein PilB
MSTVAFRTATLIEQAQRRGLIDGAAASRIAQDARDGRGRMLELLVAELRGGGAALRELAKEASIPFADVESLEPPRALLERVPEALLRRKHLLPLRQDGGVVLVATASPEDVQALDALERALGSPVRAQLAEPRSLDVAIDRALLRLDRPGTAARARTGELDPSGVDAVSLLDDLMREAVGRGASDIHVEPLPTELRVRYRVDGHLQVRRPQLRAEAAGALISRVKVLAGLDIAEKREPQDGGFAWRSSPDARPVDLRVATAPTRNGERATIRLLGLNTESLTLATLGLEEERLHAVREIIARPHGMILLSGPTGSGKSTTLYAALREINKPDTNIMTVEDPIEYSIAGVNQVQVDQVGKVSFANVLRSLLRHDPDVLMVGEIRDAETADLAMKAAMTGHLVLSTVHTNSACGAVTRLVDLGVQPFLVGSTLSAVIAQRLVRRLCVACKRPRAASDADRAILGREAAVHDAVGCPACYGTGYRGRLALFELVLLDRELGGRVSRGIDESALTEEVRRRGTRTLRQDGVRRVLEGVTTLDEVLSATVEG